METQVSKQDPNIHNYDGCWNKTPNIHNELKYRKAIKGDPPEARSLTNEL